MADNPNCEGENVFKTTQSSWGVFVPNCLNNFIEVKDIEVVLLTSTHKIIFDNKYANDLNKLLVNNEDNSNTNEIIIETNKVGIYQIPFYANLRIGQGSKMYEHDKLLPVKYSSGSAGNFMVSFTFKDDETRKEYDPTNNNGLYSTRVLYLLKTDIESLKKDIESLKTYFKPPTAAGGRKSRRTINRKRRAVRKRRNTKRHSKTYRR